MYKKYYSHFLTANPHIQHYASHSHHYWPDVTREATLQYWDDSAKFVDDKWGHIFGNKIPATQKLIAEVLNLSCPDQIVFAPNTHELVYRLLSCFEPRKTISILTTDSEFYSFDRQVNRLVEDKMASVDKVSTHPFDDFEDRFIEKITSNHYDMIFLSHVFFNSGMVVKNLKKIVESVKESNTMIVIDGYHGFMAIPTDLKEIEDRIFYIAGSYKYAQGGEGCCFMVSPKSSCERPLYTGWFAGFTLLETDGGNTGYSRDGYRFAGSTMDFAAMYRLEAVLTLFKKEGLTVAKIHSHIQKLQNNFRNHLLEIDHHYLTEKNILSVDYNHHGHFLTFAMPSPEHAKTMHDLLKSINVWTDFRGSRLRFGFGIYQNDCIDLKALVKPL
ncbi:MAG: aminotransferase class V-fold PLP-dependent enzyme [Rhizobacter sp.]|nr:aminotransferase class V-fold PLP-dependent enzyme [Bacteriovorax sp.]